MNLRILNFAVIISFTFSFRCNIRLRDSFRTWCESNNFASNRKAGFEYEWVEKYEAGIQLTGTEVKSCRRGTVQISDGVAELENGECFLLNVHIAEHYQCSSRYQHNVKRKRKLLLHRREILKLEQRVLQSNLEIIPIRMYFNDKNCVKVELGVGKAKSTGDKRDTIEKRDGEREIRRVMKGASFD